MIAITHARDKAKTQVGTQPDETLNMPDIDWEDHSVANQSDSEDTPLTTQYQSMFPMYPWDHEKDFVGRPFFQGSIPAQWRRYSKGGEWLFGLDVFIPLHWFWSSLEWQQ